MNPLAYLAKLIADTTQASDQKWAKGRLVGIKALSATEKGNIAEDFVVWLAQCYNLKAEPHESKRGEYDVLVADKKLEVKMASEDVSGNFQFNGIRYDTRYDFLCALGISPDQALFNIYPRAQLLNLPLVPMQKGANATFKLTRKKSELLDLSEFPNFFK